MSQSSYDTDSSIGLHPVTHKISAPHWITPMKGHRLAAGCEIRNWLEDTGSLTKKVREACDGRFSVQVRRQGSGKCLYDEARLLDITRTRYAVIREVELCCDATAWIFARTIIPMKSLSGPARRLTMLGNKPLGAVLFADPSVHRGQTQFAHLHPGQELFDTAVVGLSERPDSLWGRRTLFYLAGKPLLVNEIYLPGIPL